jgi:ATP-dependent Clp protease ATP-binding subunit ClpB
VLDEGRLTDNKGRTADFRNTIIIMTSNMGSHLIQENFAEASDNYAEMLMQTRDQVFDLLKKNIRPEFLNRIDEIIMFKALNREEIRQIVEMQFNKICEKLKENGIYLSATEEAIKWLATLGYDPHYGARPLKRVIQQKVLNELSKMILSGKLQEKQSIILDLDKTELVFRN